MKKFFFFFVGLAVVFQVFSQEKTYGVKEQAMLEKRGGLGRMAVIPFEDKMYMSDADAPIGRETGLNPGELIVKFRNSLMESLEIEMQKDFSLINVKEGLYEERALGLEYIYSSVSYDYVLVSDDVMMANDTTIKKKDLNKKKKAGSKESGLKDGQIVTYSDSREKYMATRIQNDTLLSFMNNKLSSNYYLFLNEFDIRHFVANPDKIASGGMKYRLKIHFTCLSDEGEILVSGMTSTLVPSSSKNIYEIIQLGIPELSAKLAKLIRKYAYEKNN